MLTLVETVNFIDKKNRTFAEVLVGLRFCKNRLHIFHTGFHGGKGDEALLSVQMDDVCEARLSAARRSPKDHAWNRVRFNALAEHAAFAQNLILSQEFIQGCWT